MLVGTRTVAKERANLSILVVLCAHRSCTFSHPLHTPPPSPPCFVLDAYGIDDYVPLSVLAVSLLEQSTSSRASKGLEQALSDLEEERRVRQRVAEELSKVEDDAAALRSEEKRVKVRA